MPRRSQERLRLLAIQCDFTLLLRDVNTCLESGLLLTQQTGAVWGDVGMPAHPRCHFDIVSSIQAAKVFIAEFRDSKECLLVVQFANAITFLLFILFEVHDGLASGIFTFVCYCFVRYS